jgi:hypothetical protein
MPISRIENCFMEKYFKNNPKILQNDDIFGPVSNDFFNLYQETMNGRKFKLDRTS